jgi:hypothetical protein
MDTGANDSANFDSASPPLVLFFVVSGALITARRDAIDVVTRCGEAVQQGLFTDLSVTVFVDYGQKQRTYKAQPSKGRRFAGSQTQKKSATG